MNFRRARAALDLTVAAAFWGFGFIAVVWSLEALNAFEITFLRFVLAFAIGFPFLLTRTARLDFKRNLKLSFGPALILFLTLATQAWGQKYTTATKSGFITTLYVVMVPVLDAVINGRRLGKRMLGFLALAFLGTLFIMGFAVAEWNLGDMLTLVTALLAAVQIFWLGMIGSRVTTPFAFNITQCLWAMIFALPFCLGMGAGEFFAKLGSVSSWPQPSIVGLLSLAVGSTVLAFFLQVRAQGHLSPTVGGILCLLESPFALLFAFLFLNHLPGSMELIGAALIMIAAVGASAVEVQAKPSEPEA